MTDERTTEEAVRPNWSGGVPYCDTACPSHDGKRCGVLGHRPGSICEPQVRALHAELQIIRAAAVPAASGTAMALVKAEAALKQATDAVAEAVAAYIKNTPVEPVDIVGTVAEPKKPTWGGGSW